MTTKTILIVDDDADLCDNLEDILREHGYEPFSALTCADGLRLARERNPHVVLLDLRLPDGPGTELLANLKELNADCLCILVTAYADLNSAVTALERGASHYLEKPVRPSELLQLLEGVFEKVRLREEKQHAEEALKKAHDELEQRVKERTAELEEANRQLRRQMEERKRIEKALRESERRLRLLSSRLMTTQESERKWIAQELHDSIGQSLAAVKFGLERKLSQMGTGQAPPGGISLEDIISMVLSGIEETRRLMMNLRPSILDDLGILATINWFCREFQKIYSDIHIEKQIEIEEQEIPDPLKITLFRILQEALNNVAKHSKADHVLLSLRKEENKIHLILKDDGKGFDLNEVTSRESTKRGLGLVSMKERVDLSGGTFDIKSAPGTGTTVRALWSV